MRKVSAATKLAIQAFQDVARAQTRLARKQLTLNSCLQRVPEEDMPYYDQKTSEIKKVEDEKLERFNKTMEKRKEHFNHIVSMLEEQGYKVIPKTSEDKVVSKPTEEGKQ